MRVLLTGGNGFIGRHLIEGLGSKYMIVSPSHAELDVTDTASVDRIVDTGRFDAIVHAAVRGGTGVFETTMRGFRNVVRQAPRLDRVIYFGSGAEFGKHRHLVKVEEEAIGRELPRDSYGLAKLMCAELSTRYSNVLNLRLFGVYGEYEGYLCKFISNAVAKATVGVPIVIRQDVVFDYLWIHDLVRMMPVFLEGSRRGGDVNVTPTTSCAISDIAAVVMETTGRVGQAVIDQPGKNYQYTGDNSRLLDMIGPFAFTPVAEGVRRLVEYYRNRADIIDREALASDDYRRRCVTRQPSSETEVGQ